MKRLLTLITTLAVFLSLVAASGAATKPNTTPNERLVQRHEAHYYQVRQRDVRVHCFWDNGSRCLVKVCDVWFGASVNGRTVWAPASWARQIDVVTDGKVSTVMNSAWFLGERCRR